MITAPRILAVAAVSLALVALTGASAFADVPSEGQTQLVSVNVDGTGGGDQSASSAVVSQNGRYVVFASAATNMIATDGNGSNYDVFRRDLVTGVTILVSQSSAGVQANAGSGGPSVSADGRFVVFDSTADNLAPLDTNQQNDVFLRDIDAGTTTLVSVNTAGTAGGNSYSYNAAISPDGSAVTFTSNATDLVAVDTNGATDVFYRTVGAAAPATQLVSLSVTGDQAGGASGYGPASLSTDGRYVAYDSLAPNIFPSGTTGYQLYRRDMQTGETAFVSAGMYGSDGDDSFSPSISGDGSLVAFSSTSAQLTDPQDLNGVEDVYLRSIPTSTTTLISVPRASGGGTFGDSTSPSISRDGLSIAFESDGTNLTDDAVGGNGDIYVASVATGAISLVSVNAAGTGGGTGAGASSYGATLSADGTLVAFLSSATDLVVPATSGQFDVFARGLAVASITSPQPALAATGAPTPWSIALFAALTMLLGAAIVATRRSRQG